MKEMQLVLEGTPAGAEQGTAALCRVEEAMRMGLW